VHAPSGATALVPAEATLQQDGNACVARSSDGSLQQLVWSATAPSPFEANARAVEFEMAIQGPRLPRHVASQFDASLTTTAMNPMTGQAMPGPQMRDGGLIFTRKALSLYKRAAQFYGDQVPQGHAFETLVARSGHFLGVATINQQVDPRWMACTSNPQYPGCADAFRNRRAWTRFVLATQLSTFPTY
jgi:hypothetical protein